MVETEPAVIVPQIIAVSEDGNLMSETVEG